jgi:mRNA-degrading endonuclease RelE of RelBE toxin-antitoxin system
LKGRREYSLHCGQYRIPYSLDRIHKVITIEDIGKHDEVYRRLYKKLRNFSKEDD